MDFYREGVIHALLQYERSGGGSRPSEHWVTRFQYQEAGPQLLLQAFLQRIVNSGGRIEREYGLGRGRTDLLIIWPQGDQTRKIVIECKLLHKSLEQTIAEGLEQTAEYMDSCDAEAGHLVIFDRREDKRWDDKVFHFRRASISGVEIDVWACDSFCLHRR